MSIYEQLGLKPVINAAGTLTRLGGVTMHPEVVEAMAQSATRALPLEEVQAAASRIISEACGSEAGYVVSGASAGLTMAACACMARLSVKKMDLLPELGDQDAGEIIIPRPHRNSYDHAFRMAGATLVEVGMDDRAVGCGVRSVEIPEIEEAITDRTAAIAYVAGPESEPPLKSVTQMAKAHGLPVIVDAAGQLPPPENLRRFIAQGADLVVYSGGKALRGPQGTGVVAGRRDLISSIALQHLDMDVTFDLWTPPQDLVPVRDLSRAPRHGMGRGFKVSKEEIIGLLVAIQMFTPERWADDQRTWLTLLGKMGDELKDSPGVSRVVMAHQGQGIPQLEIHLAGQSPEARALRATRAMKEGTPRIFLGERGLPQGILLVNPVNLDRETAEQVTVELVKVLRSIPE